MRLLPKIFCISFFLISSFSYAAPDLAPNDQDRQSLEKQMVTNLDFIKGILDSYYAPAYWKKTSQSWDLEDEFNKAKNLIQQNPKISVKEFQRILKKFLSTTHDYHVAITFESTEVASLPFIIKGAEGRYFVVDVDRARLSQTIYPIEVGDELITFNGKSVEKEIEKILSDEFSHPFSKTDEALAEMLLTFHAGKKGDIVPRDPVLVTFKHAASGQEKSYQLIWDYKPEKIKDINSKKPMTAVNKIGKKAVNKEPSNLSDDPFFRKMLSPIEDKFIAEYSKKKVHGHDIGARESFVPPLGRIVWRSDPTSPFFAYIFMTNEDKIVGYVRIATYKAGVDESQEFNDLMELMQNETDALVIDQINNPGGSLFFLYSLLSYLTDKPLYTPKHRISLNQKDISFVLKYIPLFELIENDDDAKAVIGQSFDGMPVTYQLAQFMLNYFRFIIEQWEIGNTLTEPSYVYGVDFINPSPYVNFTKPILLLVNELDFSGGDFFPAILQDNQRAVLLGTKTAGAGGMVDKVNYINLLGIEQISLTASIAARVDQNPIENLGVTPDIKYELTADDLQNGYQGYVEAINNALDALMH